MPKNIVIKGARVNNLKNIDVEIPRDSLVVLTGLSGSGKSSLAFDTLYAEGHRRFVESLSSYARMFLGQLDKPDVDSIEGLSPAISIDQKTTSKNPRSTVGTVTEIYDYLRLLYARLGVPHCPVCGKAIRQQTVDQIIERIMALPEGQRFILLSPVVRGKKGRHEKVLADAKRSGFARVRVDGSIYDLTEKIELDKNSKHTVDIVVDRLVMKDGLRQRLGDSVETALRTSDGRVTVQLVGEGNAERDELEFSTNYACEEHGISFGELEPRMFSFNNPYGACPKCMGLGAVRRVPPEKIIPHPELSLLHGAIAVNGFKSLGPESWSGPLVAAVGERHGFTMDTPLEDFSPEAKKALLYGTGDEVYDIRRSFSGPPRPQRVLYKGIIPTIEERMEQNGSDAEYYEQFLEESDCPECGGSRLSRTARAVTVGDMTISALCALPVTKSKEFIENLRFSEAETEVAREILKELRARLGFLISVGLDYLTLSRKSGTLSGGEAQRVKLATELAKKDTGNTFYILDEPTTGLHFEDIRVLMGILDHLVDRGNTVLVIEHNLDVIRLADYLIDMGPEGGQEGGFVVAQGTPEEIVAQRKGYTWAFLKEVLEGEESHRG